MRQAVVLTTTTMLIGATAAVAADLPPGTDVATLAEQAVTAVERAAHTADLTLTVSSAMRASTGERAYPSTGTMTVHQAVQSATRSLGTMTEVSDPVDGTAQRPRTTRVTGIGDRLYLSGSLFDGQVVWVRPVGMPLFNPADPTFRLPHPAQLVGLTAVSGEPGPFVRLRAQLGDAVVRAFAVSLRAGKSNRPVDRAAAANGTRFEERTIELVIDPATGRLVETDTRIAFAVDLNLISDWGSPITGDAVSAITSRFVPSLLATAPALRQPTDAISYAQFERNELSDALAQSLIGDAERAMSDVYSTRGTFVTTVEELARQSSRVKWVTRRVARASRGQVEVVWANASEYLLATNSASGKLYTTRGTTSGQVHRCTLKSRRCRTWG